MGYYSTVYLGVEPSLIEQLLTFVGSNKEVFKLLFKDAETVKTENGGILFQWSNIKWYGGTFPEIDELEAWLGEGERYEDFKFIRMGEEYGDCTTEGHSSQFEFFPHQHIEVHY